jgi:prepilin-type N-terminal cleavage/methylation domain-containing protein
MPCVVDRPSDRRGENAFRLLVHDQGAMPMGTRAQTSKGFSLMELVIVVSVFGVLMAIAIPAVGGYLRSTRIVGAVHTLEADFHYAHSLAYEQRKTYEIVFQPGSYVIAQASPYTAILTRTMPKGVTCAASDTATFYAWGLTDPVTITMASTGRADTLRLAANGSVTHD